MRQFSIENSHLKGILKSAYLRQGKESHKYLLSFVFIDIRWWSVELWPHHGMVYETPSVMPSKTRLSQDYRRDTCIYKLYKYNKTKTCAIRSLWVGSTPKFNEFKQEQQSKISWKSFVYFLGNPAKSQQTVPPWRM